MRKTTETRPEATSSWIREHVGRKHRHRAPPCGKAPKGASQCEEGVGGQTLPATFGTCGNGREPETSRTGPERSTLVVWQRGVVVALLSVCQVPAMGPRDQEAVAESRERLRVGWHAGPFGLSPLWGHTSDSRRSGVLGGHQGEPDARTGPPCRGPGVDGEDTDEVVL